MKKQTIFIVWQTDQYLSTNDKVLAFVGTDFQKSCKAIAKKCDLTKEEYNELFDNCQVRRYSDGFYIEEMTLDSFHHNFI